MKTFHITTGILAWGGFVALWVWQLEVAAPSHWEIDVEVIAGFIILWGLFTVSWVNWNRSIYRRRHRRTEALVTDVEFDHDSLGREIVASPQARHDGGQIFVAIDEEGRKHYVPVDEIESLGDV